ncbi:hypothetical protein AAHA92_05113 [Salvia divinorum]|uniref:Uncharacterized protein n=1 Tax=Salvia divinorum TaxID=28513 RepID=A0ABD1I1E2_SALDI
MLTSAHDFSFFPFAYHNAVSESHSHFVEILRQHDRDHEGQGGLFGGGEALVACLREVPALYFKKDFELEDGTTFRAACPFRTMSENVALQERLSQYLDVVELHLVREISVRSSSFFEAQLQLEDLNFEDSTRVQELSGKRGDMFALQNKLRLMLSVNQAVSTLQLLVASADCLGALDIIDDLQHILDRDELIGLHCFHHRRDHVTASMESVNSILSAEFIQDMKKINWRKKDLHIFKISFCLFVIALLRTGKLPAILRIYRDTLATDIKTSVKVKVLNMHLESDSISEEGIVDTDGGASSLGSKLKSLSPNSFVKLLQETFKIVQTHLLRASEVKRAIEWIMGNLNHHYAAESVSAAIAQDA